MTRTQSGYRGVWSGSIIVCDLLKLSRQNTTHVPCLHPDGERLTITRLSALQLMVESQTSTEAARLMMAPGITSQREAEQWYWFQAGIWILQHLLKWVLSSVWRRINWLYLTFYPRKISFPIGWILEIGTINRMRTFDTFDRNRNIHLTINDHLTRVLYCRVIAGLRSNPPPENITIGILWEVRQTWVLIGQFDLTLGSHWSWGS